MARPRSASVSHAAPPGLREKWLTTRPAMLTARYPPAHHPLRPQSCGHHKRQSDKANDVTPARGADRTEGANTQDNGQQKEQHEKESQHEIPELGHRRPPPEIGIMAQAFDKPFHRKGFLRGSPCKITIFRRSAKRKGCPNGSGSLFSLFENTPDRRFPRVE